MDEASRRSERGFLGTSCYIVRTAADQGKADVEKLKSDGFGLNLDQATPEIRCWWILMSVSQNKLHSF